MSDAPAQAYRCILDHTKFIGKTVNHEKNVKFSPDGESVVEGSLDGID
jgi:acyl-coenzyme A thioesterase 13